VLSIFLTSTVAVIWYRELTLFPYRHIMVLGYPLEPLFGNSWIVFVIKGSVFEEHSLLPYFLAFLLPQHMRLYEHRLWLVNYHRLPLGPHELLDATIIDNLVSVFQ
jgi:hypothetical protein